jgi:hypothetical protein
MDAVRRRDTKNEDSERERAYAKGRAANNIKRRMAEDLLLFQRANDVLLTVTARMIVVVTVRVTSSRQLIRSSSSPPSHCVCQASLKASQDRCIAQSK